MSRGCNSLIYRGVNNIEGVIIRELGNTTANFINEANLYKCIFQSRKPEAEKFQDWVCEEVLPAIRKHGIYATPQTIDNIIADPDNAIRMLQALKEERQLRQMAESKISEDAPKVLLADAITESSSSCLIGELAKILTQNGYGIGQNRLFKILRNEGYLGKYGEYHNIPMQKYVEMGLFQIKKGSRTGQNGELYTVTTTKVTGKGLQYFINKFLKKRKAIKNK